MLKPIIRFAVALSILVITAQGEGLNKSTCSYLALQNQGELDDSACSAYKKSDAELNKIYRQILTDKEYKDDKLFIEKLKIAQRAWEAYRDAHINSLYPDPDWRIAYGSVNTMCRCNQLTSLTNARIEELKQWVDGTIEGDVCKGSIKSKS